MAEHLSASGLVPSLLVEQMAEAFAGSKVVAEPE
jgi:hypothetical protein